ncbi:MAG: vanomycin resistance protein VanB [Streptosporangiales bacterium]|nr:vanomycin resistance protein VanB [Streptosporangiales bacterium]
MKGAARTVGRESTRVTRYDRPGQEHEPVLRPHMGDLRSAEATVLTGVQVKQSKLGAARRNRAMIAVAVVTALDIGVVALGFAAATAGDYARGTRVLGVDIGGMTTPQARPLVERAAAERTARKLSVTVGTKRVQVAPTTAGLSFDVDGTLADARADRGVASLLQGLGDGLDVPPRVRADQARMGELLETAASRVDRDKVEALIAYRGTRPRARAPRPGRALDHKASAAALRTALATGASSANLVVKTVHPTVSVAALRAALAGPARTAVASPVMLRGGGHTVELSPARVAAALRFTADGRGGLKPVFDAEKALKGLEDRLVKDSVAPRDARIELVGGEPKVIPSRNGKGVDRKALATAVEKVVTKRSGRVVSVELIPRKASFSTADAKKLGVEEKLGSFTTNYTPAPRVTNIRTIARILDGHLVKPGETFSLNGVVGKRDKARGFVEAPMILNGRYVDDVGGGVSQFATTMFNAVFFSGMQDVQHTPHSFYISRYPAGRESTVSYPQPDFRWKNNSPHGVLVDTHSTDSGLTVTFWGTKRYDIESQSSKPYDIKNFKSIDDNDKDCIPMPGAKGFTIKVWRIFKNDGAEVKREEFRTVYQPEPKVTCTHKAAGG